MEKTRNCPYCGEEIMADAKKCRHCGEWLEEEPIPEQSQEAENTETNASVSQNAAPEQTKPVMPTKRQSLMRSHLAVKAKSGYLP